MLYASVGANMTGSYSKIIHEALGYPWELLSLKPAEVEQLLKSREFGGLSITIPYKKLVIPFCDKVSDLAKKSAPSMQYILMTVEICAVQTRITRVFSLPWIQQASKYPERKLLS